jgi:hypothetical protein
VDAALDRLSNGPAPRRLELLFNIPFQARVFEKWFFFGSKFLPDDYQSLTPDDLRNKLVDALTPRQTQIVVRTTDSRTGTVHEPFIYG